MKTEQFNLRSSPDDKRTLRKAIENLQDLTGKKQNASKTIRAAVKMVADSKPELFFVNRQAIREVDSNIIKGQLLLQVLLDQFSSIDVKVSIEDIQSWFGTGRVNFMVANNSRIREFITEKLLGAQRGKYPELKITRENIEIPNLDSLLEAAHNLISVSEVNYIEAGILWSCYQINEGKISVSPAAIEKVKDKFRGYAETSQEREKLASVKELCRVLDTFSHNSGLATSQLNIKGVCYYDSESGRQEPCEQYIKYGIL